MKLIVALAGVAVILTLSLTFGVLIDGRLGFLLVFFPAFVSGYFLCPENRKLLVCLFSILLVFGLLFEIREMSLAQRLTAWTLGFTVVLTGVYREWRRRCVK